MGYIRRRRNKQTWSADNGNDRLTQRGPEGAPARSVQAGGMVFWVIVPLGAYLVLYLV